MKTKEIKGHQESRANTLIKNKIIETANEFGLKWKDRLSDKSITLTDGVRNLILFYRHLPENYQGMYSFNGGNRMPFYNFRACIINKFDIHIKRQ